MKGLPSEGQVPIGHDMPPPSRTIWAHTRRIAKSQRPTAEENGRAGKQPEPRRLCHGCRGQGWWSHLLDAPVLDSIVELGPCELEGVDLVDVCLLVLPSLRMIGALHRPELRAGV